MRRTQWQADLRALVDALLLFGLRPNDAVTIAAVVLLMLFIALVAATAPACRAARVVPTRSHDRVLAPVPPHKGHRRRMRAGLQHRLPKRGAGLNVERAEPSIDGRTDEDEDLASPQLYRSMRK